MPRDSRPDPDRLLPGDRLPVPEVLECDSETAWAEFERLNAMGLHEGIRPAAALARPAVRGTGHGFEPTVPIGLPAASPGPASHPQAAPTPLTLQDVMAETRRYNRVCPLPGPWQELYDLLPGKVKCGATWQPPPPIAGAAWQATSAIPKRMFLRDHIEWAEHHGALEQVMQFLQALPESQWHHMDD